MAEDPVAFMPGAIRRMEFHQFMTYSHATVEPGPRLNLVLAPNGCGKSTIVAALIFVLDGDMKLMARAEELRHYVQRGKDLAWVEVSLHDGPTIRHTIELTGDLVHNPVQSHYFTVNGTRRPIRHVKAVVASFGIQVSNLTQFLPQERVSDFAGMNPEAVLVATEKAVLGDAHFQLHEKIRDKKRELDRVDKEIEEKVKQCELKENSLRLAKEDKQRFEQHQRILREMNAAECKIPAIVLNEMHEEATLLREQKSRLVQELRAMEAALGPQRERVQAARQLKEAVSNRLTDAEKEMTASQRRLREAMTAHRDARSRFNAISDEIVTATETVQRLRKRVVDASARLEASRQALREVEQQEERERGQGNGNVDTLARLGAERDRVLEQLTTLRQDKNDKKREIDEANAELRQLRQRASDGVRLMKARIDTLLQYDRQNKLRTALDAIDAFKREGRLKGRVYFIPAEINVRDPLHAKYLAAFLPSSMFRSFVCESAEDRDLLATLRGITVYYRPQGERVPEMTRPCNLQQLRRFGITGWMDEVFTAPTLVRAVLLDDPRFGITAVGTRETEAQSGALLNAGLVKEFYTPSQAWSVKTSFYDSSKTSVSADTIDQKPSPFERPSRVEGQDGVVGEEERAMQERITNLQGEIVAIERLIQEMQDRERRLRADQEAVRNRGQHKTTLERKIRTEADQLITAQNSLATSERELQRHEESVPGLTLDLQQRMCVVADLLASHYDVLRSHERCAIEGRVADAQHRASEEALRRATTHMDGTRLQLDQVKQRIEAMRRSMAEQLQAAEAARKAVLEKDYGIDDDIVVKPEPGQEGPAENAEDEGAPAEPGKLSASGLQLLWEKMPDTVAELGTLIDKLRVDLSQMSSFNDRHALDTYRDLVKTVEEFKAQVETMRVASQDLRQTVAELHSQWADPISSAVEIINKRFRELAHGMGVNGEIVLVPAADYERWRLEIRVMFRVSDGMHVLTGTEQSGGEKSVSTMLYLLSLQALSRSPIRVVDEINQGMDPRNERNVFKQILISCSGGGAKPQYFLITPKLLENLIPEQPEWAENLTVISIMNGPYNMKDEEGFKI